MVERTRAAAKHAIMMYLRVRMLVSFVVVPTVVYENGWKLFQDMAEYFEIGIDILTPTSV